MKLLKKFYFLIENINLTLIYSVFYLFSLNCSSQKFQDNPSPSSLPLKKTHVVFSNFRPDAKLSIYSEKFSKKGSLMVLKEGKISPNALYAEYILSSISPASQELTQSIFKVDLPRFSLNEKIYVGNFFQKEGMQTMEIELERVFTRTRQGKDMEDLLNSKLTPEYKESEIMEKIVFIPKKDFSLWKGEEWVIQNQKPYLWRNFEEGTGFLSKIAFSEFHSPLGTLYAKILLPQEYQYRFGRDSNPVPLYTFYDFEIASDLKPFLSSEEKIPSSTPTPVNKNSLPKLYIHKILNTNGN